VASWFYFGFAPAVIYPGATNYTILSRLLEPDSLPFPGDASDQSTITVHNFPHLREYSPDPPPSFLDGNDLKFFAAGFSLYEH